MSDSEIQGHTNDSTRTCTSSKNNIKATNVMAVYEIFHIMYCIIES